MNEDIQFLKDLQKQLRYQSEHDYDSQASPRFWVIMDYRTIPGNEEYDNGFDQYFYNDGDHTEFKNFDELQEFIGEHYQDDVKRDVYLDGLLGSGDFEELWEYIEENINEEGFFSKVFVKEESFLVPDTMFLTKEEAKRHLELNHYHYSPKAHTYAMTAWRAPKVERLLNILENFDWENFGEKEELSSE